MTVRSADELVSAGNPVRVFWSVVQAQDLSDIRVDHGDALDGLFTRLIATLVGKKLIKVYRISQSLS